MSAFTDLVERLRALVFRGREDRELQEEMDYHLELEIAKNIRDGIDPIEARRRARITFGGVSQMAEEARDARGVRPLEDLGRDLRHAVRTLARRPGFTIVAVSTLAIGIGASTAMFTLVNSVLLRPLSYSAPERLVFLAERAPGAVEGNSASPRTLTAWRKVTSFEAMTAFTDRRLTLRDDAGGEAAEVSTRLTTTEHFTLLGGRARLGRTLLPGDESQQRIVLSHALWESRYGRDPGVLGRTIMLNDVPHTVIGVMPPDFRSVRGRPEAWTALVFNDPDWLGRYLHIVARLRSGATMESARAELETIAARMSLERLDSHKGWGVVATALQDEVIGKARPALLILLGAVSLLLLIACANVASLFLGRAASRRKEMAVRRSLGATRGRLIVHTMGEAFVVAAVAGLVGVMIAHWGTGLAVRSLPADIALPRLDEVTLDARAVGFAVAVSLLTGVLFGVMPALSGSAVNPGAALRESTRGSTGTRTRLRNALVVAEVALAVMLLAGAGLLVRTVQNLMHVDSGMKAGGVLTMRLSLPGARYTPPEGRRAFVNELLPRLAALPGVTAVGSTSSLPLTNSRAANGFFRNDRPTPGPGESLIADYRVVGGRYFAAMGMPVLQGRVFDATDDEAAPPRYVINEALAQRYFPGENPIGKRITYEWFGAQEGEIIGVVGSVRETALDAEPAAAVYRPQARDPLSQMTIVVRTAGDPVALGPGAAAAMRAIDPTLPAPQLRTLEQVVTGTLSRQRLMMFLLASFAVTSLLLVIVGLYGVISWSVAQRAREIGVRIALGAGQGNVLRLVVGEGVVLAAIGLAIGIPAALVMSRLLAGMLFGVRPADPGTLAAVASLLAATTLLASWIPASRAARIDPALVLGAEG